MKNIHNCVNCLKEHKKIYVNNYIGFWSVIDDYKGFILLEHNYYGDETCLLVAKANNFYYEKINTKILPCFNSCDVYETFDDILTTLKDYDLI